MSNNIESHNISDKRGLYKLTCNNWNKFYNKKDKKRTLKLDWTNKERTSTGKSTFSEHILNAGYDMRPMEETMKILHFQNDPKRINAIEEM